MSTDGTILILSFLFILFAVPGFSSNNRSFTIDSSRPTFLKDGKPFRYISGSLHYSRVHPFYWKDRLLKMKYAGLNAVQTYVFWNIHNPKREEYVWTGLANLEQFLQVAQDVGLLVLLRAGPYVCGEWEFGGLPAWLLTVNPKMRLRSSNPQYIAEVDRWFGVLLPKIKPYLYENGGSIIMVQIENEYGYYACDHDYMHFLQDKARSILGPTQVLYTTDGPGYLKCGSVKGAYSTIDFGVTHHPSRKFKKQRLFEPHGPLVNSEYYTGTQDHWGKGHWDIRTNLLCTCLDTILKLGANVDMYMFEGGTHFGYWNGASCGGKPSHYLPVPTAYDYDAPLNETGDITHKYLAIRQTISKYNPLPPGPIPANTPKYPYGSIDMHLVGTVQDLLPVLSGGSVWKSKYPLTMEQVQFYYGFILYRHKLEKGYSNPTSLVTNGTRDRGYVMVDGVPMGMFNRDVVYQVNITGKIGQYLDILVENQGRISFGGNIRHNQKGLIMNVTLNNIILENWEIYPIELDNINQTIITNFKPRIGPRVSMNLTTPTVYFGKIPVPDKSNHPQDSFLDPSQWVKGQALVNGFNIGRYWPGEGPQVTLFVPKPLMTRSPNKNILVIFELEGMNCEGKVCKMVFIDHFYIKNKPKNDQLSTNNDGYDFPHHKYD